MLGNKRNNVYTHRVICDNTILYLRLSAFMSVGLYMITKNS